MPSNTRYGIFYEAPIITTLSATDTFSFTPTATQDAVLSTTDTFSAADSALQSIPTATDGFVFAESPALSVAIQPSDSFVFASSINEFDRDFTDSVTFSDASAIVFSPIDDVFVTDSASVNIRASDSLHGFFDIATPGRTGFDDFSLAESADLLFSPATSDTSTASAGGLLLSQSTNDTMSLADSASMDYTQPPKADAVFTTQVASLIVAHAATDAISIAESTLNDAGPPDISETPFSASESAGLGQAAAEAFVAADFVQMDSFIPRIVDGASVSEAATLACAFSFSDTATLTESLSFRPGLATDVGSISAEVANVSLFLDDDCYASDVIIGPFLTTADALSLADVVTRDFSPWVDTFTASESASVSSVAYSTADSFTAGATVSNPLLSVGETVGFTEAASVQYLISVGESVGFADTVQNSSTLAASDSLSAGDVIPLAPLYQDAAIAVDVATLSATLGIAADSLSLSESGSLAQAVADALTAGDTVAMNYTQPVRSDLFSAGATTSLAVATTSADSISLAESAIIVPDSAADTAVASATCSVSIFIDDDCYAIGIVTGPAISTSDSLAASDAVASSFAPLTDGFSLADSASVTSVAYSTSDSAVASATIFNPSLAIGDAFATSISTSFVYQPAISEAFGFSEAVSLAVALAVSDGATFADLIPLAPFYSDNFMAADAASMAATQASSEAATLAEVVTLFVAQAGADGVTFGDTLNLLATFPPLTQAAQAGVVAILAVAMTASDVVSFSDSVDLGVLQAASESATSASSAPTLTNTLPLALEWNVIAEECSLASGIAGSDGASVTEVAALVYLAVAVESSSVIESAGGVASLYCTGAVFLAELFSLAASAMPADVASAGEDTRIGQAAGDSFGVTEAASLNVMASDAGVAGWTVILPADIVGTETVLLTDTFFLNRRDDDISIIGTDSAHWAISEVIQ